jgi:hypothetical protein
MLPKGRRPPVPVYICFVARSLQIQINQVLTTTGHIRALWVCDTEKMGHHSQLSKRVGWVIIWNRFSVAEAPVNGWIFGCGFFAPGVQKNGVSFALNSIFLGSHTDSPDTQWATTKVDKYFAKNGEWMNEWQRFNIAPIKQRADRSHLLFHGAQSTMNSAVGSIREISPGRRETSYSGGWALRSGLWR